MKSQRGDKVVSAYLLGLRDERARWLWAYRRRHVLRHREDGAFKTCPIATCKIARQLAGVR